MHKKTCVSHYTTRTRKTLFYNVYSSSSRCTNARIVGNASIGYIQRVLAIFNRNVSTQLNFASSCDAKLRKRERTIFSLTFNSRANVVNLNVFFDVSTTFFACVVGASIVAFCFVIVLSNRLHALRVIACCCVRSIVLYARVMPKNV